MSTIIQAVQGFYSVAHFNSRKSFAANLFSASPVRYRNFIVQPYINKQGKQHNG